jgi:hypothetical protein
MKANELMIGDWVYDTILKCNTQVEILSLSGIRGDCNDNIWNEKTFEPIPLTAEILEKNGFSYRKCDGGAEEWWIEDDYYDIVVHEWSDSIWVFRYESTEMNLPHEQRTMSYLHQLQHAFHDCGIDKTIEL